MKLSESSQVLLLAMCLAASPVTLAAGQAPPRPPQMQGEIAFASGGVGEDEREAMAAARKDYNLLLTFARQGSGAYQPDVSLLVLDVAGRQILVFESVGPLFYARLAPGTYRIQASSRGKVMRQSVTLKAEGQRELVFYWDPEPGRDE